MTLMDAAACRKLSEAFYALVARDPVLRPLFPGKSFKCAIEAFSAFLVQFFEGPEEHIQDRWYLSLRESHGRFRIGPRERHAWIENMNRALEQVEMPRPARDALRSLFEHASAYLVNAGTAPRPEAPLDPRIAPRWRRQLTLDRAVAAIRAGDTSVPDQLAGYRPVFAALLGKMLDQPALNPYVREKLLAGPELATTHFSGRTLLHDAVSRGNLEIVQLLLQLGAGPNVDAGRHSPLYCLANECSTPGAARIVHVLVQAGADVNAREGSKRCTALHMAARRGNVEIARALLQAGADPTLPDSQGVTPRRRALNCKKPAVAEIL